MKKKINSKVLILLIGACSLFISAELVSADDAPYEKYKTVFVPLPAIPPIPADNSMTIEKIK